ncbi:MAG: potassium-transporting ATPase subunit KdpC [Candidatus Eiseniibacteriota bacterium]
MREPSSIRPAVVVLACLTVVTGFAYPLLVTAVGRAAFPGPASGSLVILDGRPVGSTLIGQPFDDPAYFWGRLSATGPTAYNGGASSGSNYGPLNPAVREAAETRIAALKRADPQNDAPVPVDLVTASGSGLDPHVSPAAALYQIPRVARARELAEDELRQLVGEHTEARTFGILGEPRVNVLLLNIALEEGRK